MEELNKLSLEDFKYILVSLDMHTLKVVLENIKCIGINMNNVNNIDNENTLWKTKGYLSCLHDITKNLEVWIEAKEKGVDLFFNQNQE